MQKNKQVWECGLRLLMPFDPPACAVRTEARKEMLRASTLNGLFGFNSHFGGDAFLLISSSVLSARPQRLLRSLVLYLQHWKLIARIGCEM
jgi:hypothetical protein